MNSLLAGAWELVSDTQNGIAVFTDTYYNITWAPINRVKFKVDEPTDAEAVVAYRELATAAGTYDFTGTTVVFHRVVNLNPNRTGKDVHWEYSIEGDQLTMGERVWKRVG